MSDTTDSPKAFVLFEYNPSMAAAVIFIILFIGTTAFHTFQLAKQRTWYFIPFVIGGYFEILGYVGRAIASNQSPNWTTGPYIMQSLLLLLAPTLFAASIYMVLGRIIVLTGGEDLSLIRAKWLTKIFVAGDVMSFLAQSAGGGMLAQAKSSDDQKRGTNIITGGLFIQVFFFAIFIIVSAIFHLRIIKTPTIKSLRSEVPWPKYMIILYVASCLIMVRSVFRIAEYIQGHDGALLKTEVYIYIFDAALMFLTMALFNVFHPSNIISKKSMNTSWSEPEAGGSYGYGESVGMAPRSFA
ncbi:RTA1-domain-containing protein [Cadophora sp. DSE1049]|nr:RTA1-domain-containing protein [Cadophora sp. DSE1049]